MSPLTIRPAQKEDLPILLEFEQGIIAFERPYDPTLKPGHISYYDLEAMISDTDTEVIVALNAEQQIVASAYALIKTAKPYLNHERYAYLGFMYVAPDHRGQGVNKIIVDALLKWSKFQGMNEVRLDVYNDNPGALRAYEKAGFKRHMINMRLGI